MILSFLLSDPHDLVSIVAVLTSLLFFLLVYFIYLYKYLITELLFTLYRSRGYRRVRTNHKYVINVDEHKLSVVLETFAAGFEQFSTTIYWNQGRRTVLRCIKIKTKSIKREIIQDLQA